MGTGISGGPAKDASPPRPRSQPRGKARTWSALPRTHRTAPAPEPSPIIQPHRLRLTNLLKNQHGAMITYGVYRMVHILGILILILALGGLSIRAARDAGNDDRRGRVKVLVTPGIGLFLVLLGGFGMLARLGITGGLPGWIWGKLTIWTMLGAFVLLPFRIPGLARPAWVIVPVLGTAAAYLAFYKPF